jgi:type IV pilus assembly protein PilV
MLLMHKQTSAIGIFPNRNPMVAKKHKGSTLIEVLVALLLLSFTLLGIAGLMGATARYQIGVDSRSVISLLFNDLTTRVRSNPSQGAAYVYNTESWADQQAAITDPDPLCGATDAVACTPAERAAYDVWELRTAIRRSLPQGSLLISGNPDNGLTMSFLWFDKDNLNNITDSDTSNDLRQSAVCTASMGNVQLQSCCPSVAAVSATQGVRCLNYTFIR